MKDYGKVAPRTEDEIVAELAVNEGDFFGTYRGDLVSCLPRSRHEEAGFESSPTFEPQSTDPIAVIERAKSYMTFAWGKANDRRGLSAARSIAHVMAWLWLLREDSASEAIGRYDRYGKPQLAAFCERIGVDWKALDDGCWVNEEDGPRLEMEPAILPWRED